MKWKTFSAAPFRKGAAEAKYNKFFMFWASKRVAGGGFRVRA